MRKNKEIIFFIGMVIVVIAGFFYVQDKNTLFTQLTDKASEQLSDVNWNEVLPRNIVKNSVPIVLISDHGNQCIVDTKDFYLITDHNYFLRSDELVRELNYDRENNVLTIACDLLKGEKSRLNVWYALEESERHANKYQYFVTIWEER